MYKKLIAVTALPTNFKAAYKSDSGKDFLVQDTLYIKSYDDGSDELWGLDLSEGLLHNLHKDEAFIGILDTTKPNIQT